MVTRPLHLSVSLKRLLMEQFPTDTLRHLVALREAESPGTIARKRLSEAKLEELAEMLTTGNRIPTIGWWRRAT